MTAIVPMDMLEEIQGWAPAGGFVRSQWRNGADLAPGDLFRHAGGWAVITAAGEAVTTNGRGEVVDKSPAIAWRDMEGNADTSVLWASDGAEVRTDTCIDPATIPVLEAARYTCARCGETFPAGITGHTDDNPCGY